jgi:integrase
MPPKQRHNTYYYDESRRRWIIRYYDAQGKRRFHTMPEGTSEEDTIAEATLLHRKISAGVLTADRGAPSIQVVCEDYLATVKADIRDSTLSMYQGHCNVHIVPDLGAMPITRVSYEALEIFKRSRLAAGVSPATCRKVLATLKRVLDHAVRRKFIEHNPMSSVQMPRNPSDPTDVDDIVIFQPHEIRALIEASTSERDKTLLLAASLTGARQGELFGLQWHDIDWARSQIRIRRTFNHEKWYDTKSRSSRRSIDAAPQLMAQLRAWQAQCHESNDNLVFPSSVGQPIHASNWQRRVYAPLFTVAQLSYRHFHCFRHTFCSMLLELGKPEKYIQDQLGHTDDKLIRRVYGHLMRDRHPEHAADLGTYLFR